MTSTETTQTATTTLAWSDKLQNRRRRPALYFVTATGSIVRFAGKSIPGVVRVDSGRYEKNGDWSGTDWTLTVGSARPVEALRPFEGYGEAKQDVLRTFRRLTDAPLTDAELEALAAAHAEAHAEFAEALRAAETQVVDLE